MLSAFEIRLAFGLFGSKVVVVETSVLRMIDHRSLPSTYAYEEAI